MFSDQLGSEEDVSRTVTKCYVTWWMESERKLNNSSNSRSVIYLSFVIRGGRCLSLKSAIGLLCLPIMTSVCPASSGEQTIAMIGRQ